MSSTARKKPPSELKLLYGAIITLCLFTILGFFGSYGFFFDFASHFRFQYVILSLAALAIFIKFKKRNWIIFTVFIFIINFYTVFEFELPTDSTPPLGSKMEEVSILHANLMVFNQNHGKFKNLIHEKDPDIITLVELVPGWYESLKKTLNAYPYQNFVLRNDGLGIGFFSRIPTEEITIERFGEPGFPNIKTNLIFENKRISFLLSHPVSPTSPFSSKYRNNQLEQIIKERSRFNEKMIFMGDLNITPYSFLFKKIKSKMNLHDSRKGFGIQPTWPSAVPWLGVPLDHVFISDGIVTLEREVGPHMGSDHLPLFIRLGFPILN